MAEEAETPAKDNSFSIDKDKVIHGLVYFICAVTVAFMTWMTTTTLDSKDRLISLESKKDTNDNQWREINKLKDLHMVKIPGRSRD